MENLHQRVYALKHIETNEFICAFQDGKDYLACFSDGDTAIDFREQLKLQEHVDIHCTTPAECTFKYLWLDGQNIALEEKGN